MHFHTAPLTPTPTFPVAGDIYLWERHTAYMLYCIRSPPDLGHLTAFAWNRASADACMLATGTHEGKVYLWALPQAPGSEKSGSGGQPGASPVDSGVVAMFPFPSPGLTEASEGTLVRSPTESRSSYGWMDAGGARDSPVDRMGSMARYRSYDEEDVVSSVGDSPSDGTRRRSLSRSSEGTIDA